MNNNKIVIRPYIYTLLLAIVMQGCESGEGAPAAIDSTTVDEATTQTSTSQLPNGSVTADKLADNAALNNIGTGTILGEKLADKAVTEGKLNDELQKKIKKIDSLQERGFNPVPAGVIMAWPGKSTAIPDGWAHANGAQIDCGNGNYEELCDALDGVSWSTKGDSYLPDLRGLVLRGLDTNKTVDPDCDERNTEVIEYRDDNESRLIFANSDGEYVDGDNTFTIDDQGNIEKISGSALVSDYSVYSTTSHECEVGSYQADATAAPKNENATIKIKEGKGSEGDNAPTTVDSAQSVLNNDMNEKNVEFIHFDKETRMRNAAVHYIISCGNDYPDDEDICTREQL